MAIERVTVEQNGERFTLEVPEGTSDDDIRSFLTQQQGGEAGGITAMTQAGANPAENIIGQGAIAATPAAVEFGAAATRAALNAPLTSVTAPITSPLSTARNIAAGIERLVPQVPTQAAMPAGSLVTSVPAQRAMNVGEALMAGGRNIGSALAAPESAFLMPYNLAAYEQQKIRQNPSAPGLEYNPFAQQVRGEFPTQGAAAASNRRQAIRGQQYGGLTPEEQNMLKVDRELSLAMRVKAAKKVLGQP